MDPLVEAALRKWPQVPHCHGWLALDARGDWYMRDDRVQAAGPFPQVKGSVIRHDKLLAFIHRNYGRDAQGAAYFQNGPQRVYVDLEAAPYVWRVTAGESEVLAPEVQAHTGQAAEVRSSWLDEQGRLFLACDLADLGPAFGLVHTLDMDLAADAVQSGQWQPQEMRFDEMPGRFGYVLTPRP
jgi:hypothetical protein